MNLQNKKINTHKRYIDVSIFERVQFYSNVFKSIEGDFDLWNYSQNSTVNAPVKILMFKLIITSNHYVKKSRRLKIENMVGTNLSQTEGRIKGINLNWVQLCALEFVRGI